MTDAGAVRLQKTSWAYSQSSVACPYASQSSHHGPSSAPVDRPLSDVLCARGERPPFRFWPRLLEKTARQEGARQRGTERDSR